MKKNFKKIVTTIVLSMLISSCRALTAKEKYEKGDYLGALQTTAEELVKVKEVPLEIQNEIIFRIKETENRYKNQTTINDERSQSLAYFNLWEMGYIIEKNPVLTRYSDFLSRNDNYRNLLNSTEIMKKYVNYDINNRLSSIDTLINKFKNSNVKNTSYASIYEEFARLGADTYINMASSYENLSKLETARDLYYKASLVMEDFNKNYRNSWQKYNSLKAEIDIKSANKLFEDGISYYNSNRLEQAKSKLEEAKRIYQSYGIDRNVSQIDVFLTDISRRIALNEANKNYDEAKRYYNSNDYSRAKTRFEAAKKVYNYYGNYTLVREIDVYLENIGYKEEIIKADKYYSYGERYYNSNNFNLAKENFEKAKQIYLVRNERTKLERTNVYLENIRNKTNNTINNNYELHYKKALEYIKNGDNSYRLEDSNYNYKKAVEELKNALNYTSDYYKQNEIKSKISEVEKKIINDRYNDNSETRFLQEYNRGLNYINYAENLNNKNDMNYYYNLAIESFKNALKYTKDYNRINDINRNINDVNKKINNNNSASKFNELYNTAKDYLNTANYKYAYDEILKYNKLAYETFKDALKYTTDYSKINEINKYIKELENKISNNNNQFNYLYNDYYNKAKEMIKIGDSKINLSETNYYYKEAINYFREALNYTNDYNQKLDINMYIDMLNQRIK